MGVGEPGKARDFRFLKWVPDTPAGKKRGEERMRNQYRLATIKGVSGDMTILGFDLFSFN